MIEKLFYFNVNEEPSTSVVYNYFDSLFKIDKGTATFDVSKKKKKYKANFKIHMLFSRQMDFHFPELIKKPTLTF